MNITVKILNVSKEEWQKTSKGGYGSISVTFSGDKGEQTRKFQSFNADLYRQVKALEVGSTYEVRIEKEGDFWNWKEINKVEGAAAPAPGKAQATGTGSNWDERLKFDKEKQILIVRQSQVTNAVAALGGGRSAAEYCSFAEKLVNYVNTGEIPEFDSNEVDIPEEVESGPKRGRPRKDPAVIE